MIQLIKVIQKYYPTSGYNCEVTGPFVNKRQGLQDHRDVDLAILLVVEESGGGGGNFGQDGNFGSKEAMMVEMMAAEVVTEEEAVDIMDLKVMVVTMMEVLFIVAEETVVANRSGRPGYGNKGGEYTGGDGGYEGYTK
jgi:hypothetical protein